MMSKRGETVTRGVFVTVGMDNVYKVLDLDALHEAGLSERARGAGVYARAREACAWGEDEEAAREAAGRHWLASRKAWESAGEGVLARDMEKLRFEAYMTDTSFTWTADEESATVLGQRGSWDIEVIVMEGGYFGSAAIGSFICATNSNALTIEGVVRDLAGKINAIMANPDHHAHVLLSYLEDPRA